jgi:ATP-dependent DNA ligase
MMLCKVGSEKDIISKHLKWIGERKIDGVRCLAVCDEQVKLVGRNGTDYTSKFPEIAGALKVKGIFDGEIVCDTFEHTISRVHTDNKLKSKLLREKYPATFYVFDMPSDKPLIERKKLLKMANIENEGVKLVEMSIDLVALWERAKQEKWEGIIIKNPISSYVAKRSINWLKVKLNYFKDIEFSKYSINPAGIRLEGDVFVQCSGSQSEAVRKQIDEKGLAVCEIKYLNLTDSGATRMPTFSKLCE